MAGLVEPVTVARNAVRRVEAQAGEDMRGDLGTFLWRGRPDRVHAPEIGRQQSKEPQLPGDPPGSEVLAPPGLSGGVRMYELPDARYQIGRILGQKTVQKGRTRAGKPRNEDGSGDRLSENFG